MEIQNRLENEKFKKIVLSLYGSEVDIDDQIARYKTLYESHTSRFDNSDDVLFFSSPGRIEICGNHTDHNNGKVICASINVDTLACVSKINNNNKIIVASENYADVVVNLNGLAFSKSDNKKSMALAKGVAAYYEQHGYNVGAFAATTDSRLFKGAGVSSSACFCLLIAEILNVLFNNGKVSFVENAKAAQYAENVYFGKPCGLMDQMAIAAGGITFIDFKNPQDLKIDRVKWPFENVEIVLVNTGGNHSKLTNEYAAIRKEMSDVAQYFSKDNLREVDENQFYKKLDKLQKAVNGRAILRSIHYFNENKRVDSAMKAIHDVNLNEFSKNIYESGCSSVTYLQNAYPANDLDQRILLAIGITKNAPVKVEAVRVHGGGFEGTILSVIKHENVSEYVKYMSKIFGEENVFIVNIRDQGAIKLGI